MKEINLSLPNIADGEDKSSPLANRIRKNYRHIRKWAKRTETNCFRLYDREIPQYPLAIDFYAGRFCLHYYTKSKENLEPSLELKDEVERILLKLFLIRKESIYWRTRVKRKTTRQYEKISEQEEFFTVLEYGTKFKINLQDYLDTGLFMDHRETRQMIASISKEKKILNLFSYTCSFSVQAAMKGAAFTKSIDMSNSYTTWGRENFLLNNLPLKNNPIIRADCLKFLDEEIYKGYKYNIIIIDPPTISRSKKMDNLFDIQIDYLFLINKSLKLLSPDGIIFFSTNARKFTFDFSCFPQCQIEDISSRTIPLDFHDQNIHRCWKIKLS